MHVVELWRHPVKSFQGESVGAAAFEANGVAGDREWGVRDVATGKILTARREPPLLLASAAVNADDGLPDMTLPDGRVLHGPGAETDQALSDWLGRAVSLVNAADVPASDAEFFEDATDDASRPVTWTMPQGRFVDALPVLLLTTASLRAGAAAHPGGVWDTRRFRPNVVVEVEGEGFVEDDWLGQTVQIGGDGVVLRPEHQCVRCTMVTRPQPGLERDLDVFRTIHRHDNSRLGVWSRVVAPGTVRVGGGFRVL